MVHVGTPGKSKMFVQVTRTTAQFRFVLDLQKLSATPDGTTRWLGTLKEVNFSLDQNEIPPAPQFGDWDKQKQALQEIQKRGTVRVAPLLAGTRLQITQGKRDQILSVQVVDLRAHLTKALYAVSEANRSIVQHSFSSMFDVQQWKGWLGANAPALPPTPTFTVGTTWNYQPFDFAKQLKLSKDDTIQGTSRLDAVEGEGESAQAVVSSSATLDIKGQPEAVPDSTQYVLDYNSSANAKTRFGTQTLWPLEHTATQRISALWKILEVDKQKRIGLINATPTDTTIESRLTTVPLDAP